MKQRPEQGHSDTTANGLFFQPITKLNNNAFLREVRLGSVLHDCRTCDLISADLFKAVLLRYSSSVILPVQYQQSKIALNLEDKTVSL